MSEKLSIGGSTTTEEIPTIDGKEVKGLAMKFSNLSAAIPIDRVLRMDNVVRVVVEGVITGVDHSTDGSGDLMRVARVKPLSVDFTPFEEGKDDGVIS